MWRVTPALVTRLPYAPHQKRKATEAKRAAIDGKRESSHGVAVSSGVAPRIDVKTRALSRAEKCRCCSSLELSDCRVRENSSPIERAFQPPVADFLTPASKRSEAAIRDSL